MHDFLRIVFYAMIFMLLVTFVALISEFSTNTNIADNTVVGVGSALLGLLLYDLVGCFVESSDKVYEKLKAAFKRRKAGKE